MNGVHDMGGMHGMGEIPYEENEPVFHEPWEARVYALTRALRAAGGTRWNLDAGRYELERLPPAEYLRMSYYERWEARLRRQLVKAGLTTQAEVENGTPAAGSQKAAPAVTADMVPTMVARRVSTRRDSDARARFQTGQRVRARNIHPSGHTRLPRYVRGKPGRIASDRGIFVFPDTNAHLLGENPQHLYSVRFAARDLWGEQASTHDFMYLDLWDDYLESE
jgi:nitrile hydratase subunit beta